MEKGARKKKGDAEKSRGSSREGGVRGKMELRTVKSKTDVQLDESDRWQRGRAAALSTVCGRGSTCKFATLISATVFFFLLYPVVD